MSLSSVISKFRSPGITMDLRVNDRILLTDIRPSDKPALLKHLGDKEIYQWTLRIPHPYTAEDADEWLKIVAADTKKYGHAVSWAIRDATGEMIGACGFDGIDESESFRSHRAEIGYWLGKAFWNRGIMTDVVGAACEYAFREFGLKRITANVFAGNAASARVLEKCGFQCEALVLRKHYFKDGRFLDGQLFALVR